MHNRSATEQPSDPKKKRLQNITKYDIAYLIATITEGYSDNDQYIFSQPF
jgi:hypothetical protein